MKMRQGEKVSGSANPGQFLAGAALLVVLVIVAIAMSRSTPTPQDASDNPDTAAAVVSREDPAPHDLQRKRSIPNTRQIERREWRQNLAAPTFRVVVQDVAGQPLSGVQVQARGGNLPTMTTNERGEFSFSPEPESSTLMFLSKAGYRAETVRLAAPPAADEPWLWSRVVTMTVLGPTYPVAGYVESPIPFAQGVAQAHLGSRKNSARYTVPVGADGYYRFPAVEAGDDYELRIEAILGLKDVRVGPLEIIGPTNLQDVSLELLRRANLSIQVVNATGYPVANREVYVDIESDQRLSKRATTDQLGMFTLKDVPEGRLTLATRGYPKLEIADIVFEAWQDTTLVLTVNVGNHALRGKLIDEAGQPVPGAVIEVSGAETAGETTSRFTFRAHSNRSGEFEFSQLTPGSHQLSVTSPRHADLTTEAAPEDSPLTLVLSTS